MRYAFVDVETTGLDPTFGGIVEIGIVSTDESGRVLDRYETVLNPLSKMAATQIHGIRAAHVASAPTFALVAADVAERLDGSVVVAYNASFDASFVETAFRTYGGTLTGSWTCALQGARQALPQLRRCRLEDVATHLGIVPVGDAHTALVDADTCAQLFFALRLNSGPGRPVSARASSSLRVPPLHRGDANEHGPVRRPVAEDRRLEPSGADLRPVIDVLHAVFADSKVTLAESKELSRLIQTRGLTAGDLLAASHCFLEEQIAEILRDGTVDTEERLRLRAISHHLGFPAIYIERRLAGGVAPPTDGVQPGTTVVFTNCSEDEKFSLTMSGSEVGVCVRHGVSQQTDLVVHGGPPTTGKSLKAIEYGIPLLPVEVFRRILAGQRTGLETARRDSTPTTAAVPLPPPLPPPGWYNDPQRRNQWRWWDGAAWTAQVANDGVVEIEP